MSSIPLSSRPVLCAAALDQGYGELFAAFHPLFLPSVSRELPDSFLAQHNQVDLGRLFNGDVQFAAVLVEVLGFVVHR